MLRSRFDSTGLNIAASQKIEFWRGLHNFNQTFILGTRDVSINCKNALHTQGSRLKSQNGCYCW